MNISSVFALEIVRDASSLGWNSVWPMMEVFKAEV